jgi:arginyl-tRNA synthetase
LPGNVVIASREGTVVLLEELIREATARAREIVNEKNAELDDEQKSSVAFAVAVGALRYTMLARDNTRTVTFDWESALDFNGQAAPYIQYAHVRANSILRKAAESGFVPTLPIDTPVHQLESSEIQLIDWISRIPSEIQRAADELKPLHLTNLAYELASAFTTFYNACPVIKAEVPVRQFRLALVQASRQSLHNLLNVLGIQAPEVM